MQGRDASFNNGWIRAYDWRGVIVKRCIVLGKDAKLHDPSRRAYLVQDLELHSGHARRVRRLALEDKGARVDA